MKQRSPGIIIGFIPVRGLSIAYVESILQKAELIVQWKIFAAFADREFAEQALHALARHPLRLA